MIVLLYLLFSHLESHCRKFESDLFCHNIFLISCLFIGFIKSDYILMYLSYNFFFGIGDLDQSETRCYFSWLRLEGQPTNYSVPKFAFVN